MQPTAVSIGVLGACAGLWLLFSYQVVRIALLAIWLTLLLLRG